jgi:hypothetical protein
MAADRVGEAEQAPGEPVVRSWGFHDENGLSVTLTRIDDRLSITFAAPVGSLDLGLFLSDAECGPANG